MIIDLKNRLEDTVNFLPPVPLVMTELLQALEDENTDTISLAKIISKDPSMSMNVLKVANSAFYRLPSKVLSLDHAVRMLGTKEITMICIACGAYRTLKTGRNLQTFGLDEFWEHSVAAAVIAKRLCLMMNLLDFGTVYLSALLHDVGKIILDRSIHDIYRIAMQATKEECISMVEAEKKLIGESHDAIGGWIMERWKLPQVFVDVARYHHSVEESPKETLIAVAMSSLADQFARLRYNGYGDICSISPSDNAAFKVLQNFSPEIAEMDVAKFMCDLEDADEEIAEMEGILRKAS